MNAPAAIAGLLTLGAFAAHSVVGSKEFRQFAPPQEEKEARRAWVQSLCGWHWVSVDLLVAAGLLLLVAFTETLPDETLVLRLIAGYFALCGVAWLVTIGVAGRSVDRGLLALGQWLFCFLIAGLAWFAA